GRQGEDISTPWAGPCRIRLMRADDGFGLRAWQTMPDTSLPTGALRRRKAAATAKFALPPNDALRLRPSPSYYPFSPVRQGSSTRAGNRRFDAGSLRPAGSR